LEVANEICLQDHSIRRAIDTNYFPNVPDEVGVRIICENKNTSNLKVFQSTFEFDAAANTEAP